MLFDMPVVTFFVRSNNDRARSCVLYCRVTFQGSQTEFSTKEKLKRSEWDQKAQTFIGPARKVVYFSTLTETISYNLKSAALVGNFASAKELVLSLKKSKNTQTLLSIIEKYIEAVRPKISPGTLRNHLVKQSNLEDYQQHKKQTFTPESFTIVEAERFKAWFMKRAGTDRIDTANRHITFFRLAMHHAYKLGEIPAFELINYKGEKDPVKSPVFLSIQEIEQLQRSNFHSMMLTRIKDLFLFQCFTGLSYGDLWGNWEIRSTAAGNVITGHRSKNNQSFFIPLEVEALEIINKYKGELPQYTNEVYNRILKEIAACSGIDKRLTTHVARKTFASLMNVRGWSRPSIADMLGHRSTRTSETYYIGRDFSRIEMEMKKRG